MRLHPGEYPRLCIERFGLTNGSRHELTQHQQFFLPANGVLLPQENDQSGFRRSPVPNLEWQLEIQLLFSPTHRGGDLAAIILQPDSASWLCISTQTCGYVLVFALGKS